MIPPWIETEEKPMQPIPMQEGCFGDNISQRVSWEIQSSFMEEQEGVGCWRRCSTPEASAHSPTWQRNKVQWKTKECMIFCLLLSPKWKNIFSRNEVSRYFQLVHKRPLEVGDIGFVDVGALSKKSRSWSRELEASRTRGVRVTITTSKPGTVRNRILWPLWALWHGAFFGPVGSEENPGGFVFPILCPRIATGKFQRSFLEALLPLPQSLPNPYPYPNPGALVDLTTKARKCDSRHFDDKSA